MTIFKNILSLVLPITVLIIIPINIESRWVWALSWKLISGILLMVAGLAIMYQTISSFIRIGKGTLAPWSPTKKLVIVGMYRHVRNPMILGVLIVLLGEALAQGSMALLKWAATFFVINTIYFIVSEEPGLEKRFGEEYLNYKKQVSRWLPRLTPYHPTEKE